MLWIKEKKLGRSVEHGRRRQATAHGDEVRREKLEVGRRGNAGKIQYSVPAPVDQNSEAGLD